MYFMLLSMEQNSLKINVADTIKLTAYCLCVHVTILKLSTIIKFIQQNLDDSYKHTTLCYTT